MHIHVTGDVLRRRDEILRIVGEAVVHSQAEIGSALRKRGFAVTQPTLSRDLRDLGLAKTASGYVVPGALASVTPISAFTSRQVRSARLDQIIREFVLSAQAAGNLVILKTPPAGAQPVASALDAAPPDDVLGTIGGDDTIFVALASPAAATSLVRHVRQIAGITPVRRRTRA